MFNAFGEQFAEIMDSLSAYSPPVVLLYDMRAETLQERLSDAPGAKTSCIHKSKS